MNELLRQKELALEQARYEATRAHRQYVAADPDNRLVTRNLERRWNEQLEEVARLEDELNAARVSQPPAPTEGGPRGDLGTGTELPRLWNHPGATVATRKRILRAVLEEIIVTADSNLHLKLHWKGGDHTAIEVARNRSGSNRWKTSAATEQLICGLARHFSDRTISFMLNRLGVRTAKGQTWNQHRVVSFRNNHNIAIYREGERAERGEVILQEAANHLSASKMTVIRLIKDGLLPAKQICRNTPYVIREADLDLPMVQRAVKDGCRPVSVDQRQGTLEFR